MGLKKKTELIFILPATRHPQMVTAENLRRILSLAHSTCLLDLWLRLIGRILAEGPLHRPGHERSWQLLAPCVPLVAVDRGFGCKLRLIDHDETEIGYLGPDRISTYRTFRGKNASTIVSGHTGFLEHWRI